MADSRRWKRPLLYVYLIVVHLLLVSLAFIVIRGRIERSLEVEPVAPPTFAADTEHTPEPETTPCGRPEVTPSLEPLPSITPVPSQNRSIIIPVAGVNAAQLVDTFSSARGEGRTHDAIDIMAAGGTPVLAAVTGRIARFFDSAQGGITIYQMSEDGRFVYYYAHLQRRSEEIKPGDLVTQGSTIAYVGDTGNAGPGNYHLHFSIARVKDAKRYWEGEYLNPFPYLKAGTAPE